MNVPEGLVFFFLGAGLLMSFHGHSSLSMMIICVQPQTLVRGAGHRGNTIMYSI